MGKGHAPGIATGRGASGIGAEVSVVAGFVTGLGAAFLLTAGFFLAAFLLAGFLAGLFFATFLRATALRAAAFRAVFFATSFFFFLATFFFAAFFFAISSSLRTLLQSPQPIAATQPPQTGSGYMEPLTAACSRCCRCDWPHGERGSSS